MFRMCIDGGHLNRPFGFSRWAVIAGAGFATTLATGSAGAERCDVDDYVTQVIGIEEPWVENAGDLFTQVTNRNSR